MFTTYRVPPLRSSGLGEGVRPLDAVLDALQRLIVRVFATRARRRSSSQHKRGSNLIKTA